MDRNSQYYYIPLKEPIPLTEQHWPDDVLPLVHTRTMTYMHEDFIKDCIEGLLMQKTTFPVQILIHEDSSTDKTAEIVREYEQKYPRLIKAFYQKENSFTKPNKHERRAEFMSWTIGKYEAICEGDDYWIDPLKLQKQVDFLEANPEYSLCFHNARVIYENSSKKPHLFKELETRLYTGEEILQEWTIPTASTVFKREAYVPNNNPNYIHGDIILFLTLAEIGKIWGMSDIMSVYRKHVGSITSKKNFSIQDTLKYIKHNEEISKNFDGKYKNSVNIILSRVYIGLSKKQLMKMDVSFVKSLFKSYRVYPILFFKHLFNAIFK